jgi:hypothetical protein
MASIHSKRWDRIFLKPIWFVFFLSAIKYFFDGRWGLGIFLVVAAIWGVGGIGQGLYPELSFKELAAGDAAIDGNESTEMAFLESRMLLRAVKRLTILFFVVFLVIKISSNVPVWQSLSTALLFGTAIPVGYIVFVFISGLLTRRV